MAARSASPVLPYDRRRKNIYTAIFHRKDVAAADN
jgi:hypothetical protein